MNKSFALTGVLLAAALAAGCGDNGLRSPDFDAQLKDVIVSGPTQIEANRQAQYRAVAEFTTPPSQGGTSTHDVTNDVTWSIVQRVADANPDLSCTNSTVASTAAAVDAHGLVTAGPNPADNLYVKATLNTGSPGTTTAFTGCAPLAVIPATAPPPNRLRGIVVQPDSATVPKGGQQQYCARGFYSDQNNPQEITDTAVVWSSVDPTIATVPAAPNNTGSCIIASAVAVGSTQIKASANNADGVALTDTGDITVPNNGPVGPKSLLRLEPATATVVVGATQQFTACGVFSDSSNATSGPCSTPPTGQAAGQVVDPSLLDWTSDKTDQATVDPAGLATGVKKTAAGAPVAITATLKTGVGDPAPAQRSASSALTVLPGDGCTVQLLPPNATTVDTNKGALCLACSVDNKNALIDSDPLTFARMNATLSALDLLGLGFIDVTVNATQLDPGGHPVGFIIGRPANDLLAAEVLASLSITTLKDGVVVDTSSASEPLVLDLLGTVIPGVTEGLVFFQATHPFNSLRLTFSPTVAAALTEVDAFKACKVATPPTP